MFGKLPNPIDTSKAYLKTVREATQGTGTIGSLGTQALSVVVDPYSGKYYGEAPQQDYLNHYSSQLKGIQSNIEYLNKYGRSQPVASDNPMANVGGLTMPLNPEAKATLLADYTKQLNDTQSELAKFSTDYVQKPQMLASFNAHPDGWDNYFQGSYRNPRLAESNASSPQGSAPRNPLAINSPIVDKVIPKTVGTGVASTSPINPFGRLDSGLNI